MKSPVFGSGFGRLILVLRSGSDVKPAITSTSWKDRIGQVLGGSTGQKIVSNLIGATKRNKHLGELGTLYYSVVEAM